MGWKYMEWKNGIALEFSIRVWLLKMKKHPLLTVRNETILMALFASFCSFHTHWFTRIKILSSPRIQLILNLRVLTKALAGSRALATITAVVDPPWMTIGEVSLEQGIVLLSEMCEHFRTIQPDIFRLWINS